MATLLRVLTDRQVGDIHEQSLAVLARTGMRIDSAQARGILRAAGAEVDEPERRVRFPRALVEASLAAAPRSFALGGRRPGFSLPMNAGECTLIPDGEATMVYDPVSGVRRASTRDDWVAATRLVDSLDEVGAYWQMVTAGDLDPGAGPLVAHWAATFELFSKHVQDAPGSAAEAAWLLELLAVVFGSREAVRRDHPYSILYCPVSPLAMEEDHTDAWLATAGWDIPIAIMPMPMMGSSAPTGLRSTIVTGNAEVLGTVCLVQAAAPGTPVIYAPALAAMEPRTGRWGGGSPEHALLGAATTEMGRFYGLPVTASNGGTDHFVAGVQAAYERTLNWVLPALSWPDILIGPGSLGGASTLCLEQLVIDVEVYRACRHLRRGIGDGVGEADVVAAVDEVGPMGDFLAREATRDAVRAGEFFLPGLGWHGSFDRLEAAGRPDILAQARETALAAIAGHQPIPFPDEVASEVAKLERRARAATPAPGKG
ncbi:MAG: trimethylamine methyltransferase family protein [Chloroflexota bacterium]